MVECMAQVGMHEAKTTLSRLVERAEHGEEVVITRNGTPVVRLVPVAGPNRLASAYGALAGEPILPEGLEGLPEEVAEAFGMS